MNEQPTYSPTEIQQAQRQLGLSDSEFGFVLGCNSQHVRRLKVEDPTKGSHRTISPSQARLLRAYIEDNYMPQDWPA